MSKDKVLITLQVSPQQRDMLAELAKAQDLSRAQLIRKWINKSYEEAQK